MIMLHLLRVAQVETGTIQRSRDDDQGRLSRPSRTRRGARRSTHGARSGEPSRLGGPSSWAPGRRRQRSRTRRTSRRCDHPATRNSATTTRPEDCCDRSAAGVHLASGYVGSCVALRARVAIRARLTQVTAYAGTWGSQYELISLGGTPKRRAIASSVSPRGTSTSPRSMRAIVFELSGAKSLRESPF